MNPFDDDMRPVLKWLLIALLGVALGVCAMVSEGQPLHDCTLSIPMQGIDVTELVHEAYAVYRAQDIDRWYAIRRDLIALRGGFKSRYVGTANVGGSWVLVATIPNGYWVQIGDDWTVGEDNQVHSPRCILIAPTLPPDILHDMGHR